MLQHQKSGSSNGMFSLLRLVVGSGRVPLARAEARSIVSAIDGQLSISSRKFSSSIISCMCSTKKLMQYSFRNAALNFSAAHRKRPTLLIESTSCAATSHRCFSGRRRYCSASVKRSISCYKKKASESSQHYNSVSPVNSNQDISAVEQTATYV